MLAEKVLSITATVEDGDEKSGAGSDEGPSPQSLPGGFIGLALMVVLQARVCLPGHCIEANCLHKLGSADMIWKLESGYGASRLAPLSCVGDSEWAVHAQQGILNQMLLRPLLLCQLWGQLDCAGGDLQIGSTRFVCF